MIRAGDRDELASQLFRFVGANVRGTPAMIGQEVAEDLELLAGECSVLALQEFRHRWYWSKLRKALQSGANGSWSTFPGVLVGLARPTYSGQAIAWRRGMWRKLDKRRRRLHKGHKRISEPRQLRAVLLEDRTSGLAAWFGTTHFVVRGDMRLDPDKRRGIMRGDLAAFDLFLDDLVHTGHPGAIQLDANLTPHSTAAWEPFLAILRRHGCTIHGVRGVEYLITWPGRTTWLAVATDFDVPARELNTDHEARGIAFRLATRRR